MKRLVDIAELSRILSIPTGSLYNLVSQRRIPFVKIGHRLRFDIEDISRWVEQNKEEAQYEHLQSTR